MHVVIFEDAEWESLAPLTFSRPAFDLLCGTTTLLQKQVRSLAPSRLTLWVRPEMVEMCRRQVLPQLNAGAGCTVAINEPLVAEPVLLINARLLCLERLETAGPGLVTDEKGAQIAWAVVTAPGLGAGDALSGSAAWRALLSLPRESGKVQLAQYLWDLISWNEEAIAVDARQLSVHSPAAGAWHLVGAEQIYAGHGVKLNPGCVIDASKGAVVLGDGAIVGANAVLQGPCYIGSQSEVAPLAMIRPGTSIGPKCKVGGEVARAIILGNSNKGHEGFLGDSYLGEWVNLGAGTTTSNLKNTYGPIGIKLGREEVNSGRQFLGALIGDHTKTAIGTRFMSGSYAGCCSMIATSAHAPRFTPSFSFLTDKGTEAYRLDKVFEVARAVMARRGRTFDALDEAMVRYCKSAAERAESVRA